MKTWVMQLAGAVVVLVFALAVGGFVMVLRAQQESLAGTMASAHIRAVSPPDGATNVPLSGEIRADYVSRAKNDPAIKLEPPVGVTLHNPRSAGTTFVIDYHGPRDSRLHLLQPDPPDWTPQGASNDITLRCHSRSG